MLTTIPRRGAADTRKQVILDISCLCVIVYGSSCRIVWNDWVVSTLNDKKWALEGFATSGSEFLILLDSLILMLAGLWNPHAGGQLEQ